MGTVLYLCILIYDVGVIASVLVANLGASKTNQNSIVFKLQWNMVSVLMTGDFEGGIREGPMKQVKENFYPRLVWNNIDLTFIYNKCMLFATSAIR